MHVALVQPPKQVSRSISSQKGLKLTRGRQALITYVDQAVGIDLSEKMVAEYRKWAERQNFDSDKVCARQLDLLAESDAASEAVQALSDFDIAVVSMALHHVSDPGKLLSRLARTLRSGGVCVVLDRVPTGAIPDISHNVPTEATNVLRTINKHGFTQEEMHDYFEDAGIGKNFDYVVIDRPFEFMLYGQKMQSTGFIARGEVA